MTEVLDHSQAAGAARLVLLAYAERADARTREAWPGDRELMRRAKVHKSTVSECRRQLVALGELVPTTRRRGRRRVYRIATLNQPRQGSSLANFRRSDLTNPKVGFDEPEVRLSRTSPVDLSVEPVSRTDPLTPAERGDVDRDWLGALERLREQVTELTFDVWLRPLELIEATSDRVVVSAPPRSASWVRDRYLPLITDAVARSTGRQVEVEIAVSDEERAAQLAREEKARADIEHKRALAERYARRGKSGSRGGT